MRRYAPQQPFYFAPSFGPQMGANIAQGINQGAQNFMKMRQMQAQMQGLQAQREAMAAYRQAQAQYMSSRAKQYGNQNIDPNHVQWGIAAARGQKLPPEAQGFSMTPGEQQIVKSAVAPSYNYAGRTESAKTAAGAKVQAAGITASAKSTNSPDGLLKTQVQSIEKQMQDTHKRIMNPEGSGPQAMMMSDDQKAKASQAALDEYNRLATTRDQLLRQRQSGSQPSQMGGQQAQPQTPAQQGSPSAPPKQDQTQSQGPLRIYDHTDALTAPTGSLVRLPDGTVHQVTKASQNGASPMVSPNPVNLSGNQSPAPAQTQAPAPQAPQQAPVQQQPMAPPVQTIPINPGAPMAPPMEQPMPPPIDPTMFPNQGMGY